jgi:glycopeptide antibiotics resistance protein
MAFLRQRILILLEYQPFWRAMLAFLQLAVVTRLAWPGLGKLWIVIGLLAFGLGIELVQAQLPYRTFAIADILADAAGIAIGLLPCPGFIRPRTQNDRPIVHANSRQ